VLEYTGAQRSVLILAEEGILQVIATGDANAQGDPEAIQPRLLADDDTELAAHVARFVWRTAETVYIADAQKHHAFKDDRYLAQQGVRSILCYPIVRKNQVSGMFYLENNLLADAFKTEQMFALDLLAAQIAISIDNSRLYKRSQQAIAARDTFLSIASHELKTPLTPLKIQVQSLFRCLQKGKVDQEKMRTWALRAERQIDRLNRLVNDLLDVSHIDQGIFRVHPKAVDLADIVNDVLAWCQDDLARAGCHLISQIGSVRGAFDRPRIEQVVSNLVLNAAKYAAGATIRVTLAQRLGRAHLQVADDGPGIAAVHQAAIFERYARGGAVASAGGLGLGLFIAKQIVAAHGGRLTVSSCEGDGATFTMDLPLGA
ncbi:MAG: sensor histidine kinase, partial [Oxalobacteraceae bacterium]